MNKICDSCKLCKDISLFNKNRTKKDGYANSCRECANKQSREYYKNNKDYHQKIININNRKRITINKSKMIEYLSNKSCKDCNNHDIRVLQFDHLPEFNKKGNVSNMINTGCSWNTILNEIKKCEIVCTNCHSIRTFKRSAKHYKKIVA